MKALNRVGERIWNVNSVSSIHIDIKSCKKVDCPDCGIGNPSIKGGKECEGVGAPTVEGAGGPKCGIGVPTIRGGLSVGLNPPGPLLGRERLRKLKNKLKIGAISKLSKVGGYVVLPPRKHDPAGGTSSGAAPAAPATLPSAEIPTEEILDSLVGNFASSVQHQIKKTPGEEVHLKMNPLKVTLRSDEFPISTNMLNSMRNVIYKKLSNPLVSSVKIKVSIGRSSYPIELLLTKSNQVPNDLVSQRRKSLILKDVKVTDICTIKILKSDGTQGRNKKKK